jgi:hypothetical protein
VSPSKEGGTIRGLLCRPTFGADFHQQFGAHLVKESKTAW